MGLSCYWTILHYYIISCLLILVVKNQPVLQFYTANIRYSILILEVNLGLCALSLVNLGLALLLKIVLMLNNFTLLYYWQSFITCSKTPACTLFH